MAFWNDVVDVLKDAGTSTTRIVTDTVLDVADVATGYQFSKDIKNAKKEMSEAGVITAAEAIEKNHYSFLEDMAIEAEEKIDHINSLLAKAEELDSSQEVRLKTLGELLTDINSLSQMSSEATELMQKLKQIPGWEPWNERLELDIFNLEGILRDSTSEWTKICQHIAKMQLAVGATDFIAGGVSVIASVANAVQTTRAAKSLQLSSSASAGTKVGKASKLLKLGRAAGKASAVLTVATVGLDIGLSVAQLEEREEKLEKHLSELTSQLREAEDYVSDLRKENRELTLQIDKILSQADPPHTLDSWNLWVEEMEQRFKAARNELISAMGIRERATKMAIITQGRSLEDRISAIARVDSSISKDDAAEIIDEVDRKHPIHVNDHTSSYEIRGKDWDKITRKEIESEAKKLLRCAQLFEIKLSKDILSKQSNLLLQEFEEYRPIGQELFSTKQEIMISLKESIDLLKDK